LEWDKTLDEEVRTGDVLTNMGVREAERWGEEGEVFDGRESWDWDKCVEGVAESKKLRDLIMPMATS
jgi:hypothetical protein